MNWCHLFRGSWASCVISVLGVLMASVSPLQAETSLRWKFAEGQAFRVDFDQQTTNETTGAGKPSNISMAMQMQMMWNVESVDDEGTAKIRQRIDRFAVTMKSGTAEPIVFDSSSTDKASGPAAELAATVTPLIGIDFTVVMTSRGTIREVVLSDRANEVAANAKSPTIKSLFSVEGISQLLQQSAIPLPEVAVEPGATWTVNAETTTPLGLTKQSTEYTLVGPEEVEGTAGERIHSTTTLQLQATELSPSQLKIVDHQQSGSILFDTAAGRLRSSKSTLKLNMSGMYREFKMNIATTMTSQTTIEPSP